MEEKIRLQLEEVLQKIEDFQIRGNWDCKKLRALCDQKMHLLYLLNLAQSAQIAIPNKAIFGVNL